MRAWLVIAVIMMTAAVAAPQQGLQVGDMAPDFELEGSDGNTYRLSDFRDKQAVVIAWFPRAYTRGCTIECKSLAENGNLIKEYNASGLSQGVFWEQRGVNFDSFRRRYRRSPRFSGKRRKPSQKAFSELTRPLPPPTGGLVVWLGETVRIDLIRSSRTLPVE